MRRNILTVLSVILLSALSLKAQYVDIPDPVFRGWLETMFPTCMNAGRLDTTCGLLNGVLAFGPPSAPDDIINLDGIQYFKNMKQISYGSKRSLEKIPALPPFLEKLTCDINRLTSLPELPSTLTNLDCGHNPLTSLPELPASLRELHCPNMELATLPELPGALERLSIQGNELTTLPALPESLKLLNCAGNQLLTLPELPVGLTELYCESSNLLILPDLPDSLVSINCSYNKLTNLPALPQSLKNLWCYNNYLTSLPELPSQLKELICNSNQLVNLPILPATLYRINCGNNKLTSLPALPVSLVYLYCYMNYLVSLPPLHHGLGLLNCSQNPDLSCLPLLPSTLHYGSCPYWGQCYSALSISGTNISCIPNFPQYMTVDVSRPLCTDPTKVCDVQAYVQGIVFRDIDEDGLYTSNVDEVVPLNVVHCSTNNWNGISDINGEYTIKVDTGIENTWGMVPNSPYINVVPSSYSLNPSTTGLQPGNYDFIISMQPNVYDLSAAIGGGPFRPGFRANVHITLENAGTVDQNGITVKLKRPEGYNVLTATPAYSYIANDTIFWTDVAIDLFKSNVFSVQLQVPVSAELGSEVVLEAWVAGATTELTPDNNYSSWIETIVGSFDPNDKLVNSDVLSHLYSNSDRLLYTIRFQNTGTDTAFTVIVRDEIPDNLDVSSLRVVNASHPYQLIVREKNIVEVAFPNIQLPDSNHNEPGSHGFVQLSLKPKAGLPIGEEIKNSASIFFDYNAPVITNEAITTVNIISGVASNSKLDFKIFPNPANQLLRIELPYSGKGTWLLSDISGRVLQENNFPGNTGQIEIPVTSIPAGTYFLTLQMGGERSTAKVVVMR